MPIWLTFQQSPYEAPPVLKVRDVPHFSERHRPQLLTTSHIYSGKLVYAAEWMRKTKISLREEEAEKRLRKKSSLKSGRRKSWWKKMGTGLRSGTARFLTGSLPSAPWEVRSSALQTHEGHHLLQLEGQPLFPGCIILLQWTHDLSAGRWGRHTHTHITETYENWAVFTTMITEATDVAKFVSIILSECLNNLKTPQNERCPTFLWDTQTLTNENGKKNVATSVF